MNQIAEEGLIDHAIEKINTQNRLFSQFKTSKLSAYLEREKKSTVTDRVVSLHGWSDLYEQRSEQMPLQIQHLLLKDQLSEVTRCGGYWIQIDGVGIVVNPGKWFLERFHKAGFHIWDIDHICITDGESAASYDLEKIWAFNKEINTMLQKWELSPHLISCWLHPRAYENHTPNLRPHFRQEVSSLHRLETFGDSQSHESVQLHPGLFLDYSSNGPSNKHSLMLRFRREETPMLGFLSHASWSPHQKEFLHSCPTCILAIGEATFEETDSLSLGLSGITNILKENISCKTAIISEYTFSQGDSRIESLHYLRDELGEDSPTLLPAEDGLTLHLDTNQINTSDLSQPTALHSIKSSRSSGPFSKLRFFDEFGIF